MRKQLLIVFVKNIQLGKVKTRLAKTIGDEKALEVYQKLISVTKNASNKCNVDKHIFYSDFIGGDDWGKAVKFIQKGNDIGERMLNAFEQGFDEGYQQIILIGSDLPDINETIIKQGFSALSDTPFVFGPAEDGGYYLVGMIKYTPTLFFNKPWSQPNLLDKTLLELDNDKTTFTLLKTLNDIDTFEDLKQSVLADQFNF